MAATTVFSESPTRQWSFAEKPISGSPFEWKAAKIAFYGKSAPVLIAPGTHRCPFATIKAGQTTVLITWEVEMDDCYECYKSVPLMDNNGGVFCRECNHRIDKETAEKPKKCSKSEDD